ncbi:hypothetical protein EVAR_25351_1 [Eumeta japonica]|uniref:Uncharacterized protein n=1 Tax=Eumeta variegata TaxID=151549 RepID=A0A4C1Y0M2_EUMVA|nr:hypothetical protein EVAR_25351_1 [Eumeta japonica]
MTRNCEWPTRNMRASDRSIHDFGGVRENIVSRASKKKLTPLSVYKYGANTGCGARELARYGMRLAPRGAHRRRVIFDRVPIRFRRGSARRVASDGACRPACTYVHTSSGDSCSSGSN